MSKAKVAAAYYADQFETAKRADGSPFVRVRDGAPDEDALTDLIRDVHDGGSTLPTDWLYAEVRDAFERLDGYDDAEACADEAEADIMTRDRLDWLRDFPGAVDLVDEYVREYGDPRNFDLVGAIGGAQAMERSRIIRAVAAWMADRD